MTTIEETLVYDAMAAIEKHAKVFCDIANTAPNASTIREAYKAGVYAPAIKLGIALGPEAIERGRARHAELGPQSEGIFQDIAATRHPA